MKHGVVLVIILLCVRFVVSTSLIGIDFGNDYIKIAAMKPGKQMDIALNRDAQRKTPTAVAFRSGERLIGDSALLIATKQPKQAFLHIPLLLGQQLNSPIVRLYQTRYPHHRLVTGIDGTLAFLLDDNHQLSVEQLAAMLLEAAMETALVFLSEDVAHTKTADRGDIEVALTVPPFWGQSERQALLRAAQYAGMCSVRLINSNAAVSVNFGSGMGAALTKKYTFFDMGATSTVVTLVSYSRVLGLKNRALRILRIHSVGYDAALGAIDFIDRLAGLNVTVTNDAGAVVKDTKSDPRDDRRGSANPKFKDKSAKLISKDAQSVANDATSVAKARQAASRLFRVLSANRRVGSMTRDQLRVLTTDLLGRLRRVVEITIQGGVDIGEEIQLMGGGTRCPLVQEELLNVTGRSKLGHSINTDEAAALGAVQHLLSVVSSERGISSGRGQTAALTLLVDVNLFPVVLLSNMTGSKQTSHSQQLMKLGDRIPQNKTISFDVNEAVTGHDFYIALEYNNLAHLSEFQRRSLGNSLLVKYRTLGLFRLLNRFRSANPVNSTNSRVSSEKNKANIKIEAGFRHDSSGLIRLEKLDLVLSTAEKPDTTQRQSINFQPVEFGYQMPSEAQRLVAKAVVSEFRQREEAMRAVSLSRNNLEAAVIHARSRLLGGSNSDSKNSTQSNTPVYALCSNPKERRQLLAALVSAERLLASGNLPSTVNNATVLDEELKKFKSAFAAVSDRADELVKRPPAMARLSSTIRNAKLSAKLGTASLTLLRAIQNVQNWYLKANLALERLDLTRDPPILSRQIDARRTILEQLMAAKQTRKKPTKKERRRRKTKNSQKYRPDATASLRSLGDYQEQDNNIKLREPQQQPPKPDETEYRDEDNDEPDDPENGGHDLQSPNYDDL